MRPQAIRNSAGLNSCRYSLSHGRPRLPRARRTSTTASALCRVAGAHYCAPAPSEPHVHVIRAYGSSKPQRDNSGMQNRRVLARAGHPAVAGDMHEADSARLGSRPVSDQVVPGDRLPGGGEPLLPLARAAWLPVGVQQVVRAERAAALLCLDQAQGAIVQRRLVPAAPVGPVLGEARIIRGCRSWHHAVPDDLGPGELGQVAAAVTVTEYPLVLPGDVELAVVPADDPGLRLVRVAVAGPLVSELPHVVVEAGEHPLRHHTPVVG